MSMTEGSKKDMPQAPQSCEGCGAAHDGTAAGSMPYAWSGPIHWLCSKCSPGAYAAFVKSRRERTPPGGPPGRR